MESASDEQQEMLLTLLDDRLLSGLLQNPPQANRRHFPRKACSIAVDCDTGGKAFKGLAKNISLGGVYMVRIETERWLSAGQEITVRFPTLSTKQGPVEFSAEVVWIVPEGVGVGLRFKAKSTDLEDILASL